MTSSIYPFSRLPRLPPILAPAPTAPAVEPAPDEDELVVLCVGRFVGWLLGLLPIWEVISREEAAKFILTREIRVKYTPVIIELDRKDTDVEIH